MVILDTFAAPHPVPMGRFTQLAFTPAVKAMQQQMGSRTSYARFDQQGEQRDALGPDEIAFLAERDSFYMASVTSTGWPYIQHRGGPAGFLHVLDAHTLAFADYKGNRQYISLGNLATDDRVALFFMDYPRRARLKMLAHARVHTRAESPELFTTLAAPASAERAFTLQIEGFDWNCPQHITPRFTEAEVRTATQPLLDEVAALRAENAELRAKLAQRA